MNKLDTQWIRSFQNFATYHLPSQQTERNSEERKVSIINEGKSLDFGTLWKEIWRLTKKGSQMPELMKIHFLFS